MKTNKLCKQSPLPTSAARSGKCEHRQLQERGRGGEHATEIRTSLLCVLKFLFPKSHWPNCCTPRWWPLYWASICPDKNDQIHSPRCFLASACPLKINARLVCHFGYRCPFCAFTVASLIVAEVWGNRNRPGDTGWLLSLHSPCPGS